MLDQITDIVKHLTQMINSLIAVCLTWQGTQKVCLHSEHVMSINMVNTIWAPVTHRIVQGNQGTCEQ